MIRIAIHSSESSFSKRWIEYCRTNSIPYEIVNCYNNNIINQLSDCDILMWHHHHSFARDKLFAKQLLFSIEQSGKKVFPDFNTGWHFDDKVGQKYLLEAINAPLVPSYVFYSKKEALKWVERTEFPKVFKLRSGAGSFNVFLVRTKYFARLLIHRSFSRGFSPYNKWNNLKDNYHYFRIGRYPLKNVFKSMGRMVFQPELVRVLGKEKGYAYFQDFIPDNTFDIRVIVIGEKAFAIKRLVRKNDFRASGSGSIIYSRDQIDERCIKVSFETNKKLKSQCLAYDFVFNKDNFPLITEINYGFDQKGYLNCPGYWDINLKWHEGKFNPEDWIIELLIKDL